MSIRFGFTALVLATSLATRAADVPRSEGPFTDYMASRFRAEIPEATVTVKEPLTVMVGELQANLDRVFVYCQRNPDGCSSELDKYVKGLTDVYRSESAPPTLDQLLIVVRTGEYVEGARAAFGGADRTNVQPRSFLPGLFALPVLDSPRTLSFLAEKENAKLGLTVETVHDAALRNLRKALKPMGDVAKPTLANRFGIVEGDTYTSSRLLLHDSWADLAHAQRGVLLVTAPATDLLIYIADDSPAAIDALRTVTKELMLKAPNRLSSSVLRWRPSGWEIVE